MSLGYGIKASAGVEVRSGPPVAQAVREVPEKGSGDERGAGELRTFEVDGADVRIRFDFCPALVVLMRSLGIARYWRQSARSYVVPLARFSGEVEETLRRLEFEAL